MKKELFFKFLVLAVIAAFVTFPSCKDYDDDISNLEGQISALKSELPSQISAVKAELGSAMDTKIAAANGEIASLKTKLAALEKDLANLANELGNSASQADLDALNEKIDAIKTEILEKTVSLEVFQAFKTKAEEDLVELKTELEDLEARLVAVETELGTKASQDDLDALQNELDAYKLKVAGELEELQIALNALDVRVKALEEALPKLKQELLEALGVAVTELEGKIADLRAELAPRIDVLEAILKVKDGESEVINDIYDKLGEQLDKINDNASDIIDLQKDLKDKYDELVLVDEGLQNQINTNSGLIKDNKDAIDEINRYITNTLEPRLDAIEKDIEALQDRMATAETNIGINTSNIFTLSRQLKGLTFIPTRGLPSEKTMKLYYFAGDYTANHTIMYRVNPSNAMLGRDFTIESLNYQITTRSASDGVDDASENVSVALNGKVTQVGDIIYVPVHIQGPVQIQGPTPCGVFGNIDWWGNRFFFGENVLNPEDFPIHVVKTIANPLVNYDATGGNEGLSLVLTAKTESVADDGKKVQVTVKSSEMVNTELIPTQIKLAESDGKGNQIVDENLRKRLLNFTLTEAAAWANKNENTLPADDKNWNVLTWSGNKGQGGVWTPGEVDLMDYVTSFYYPQDGGDFSRRNVVDGDPHRYLYAEFGKEFGKPYTDKPNYEKPVYKFEQMIYRDMNHNIVIGPKGGKDVTHSYVELDGSILKVFNNEASIQGVRNKKIIIKVTQVNSDCEERQPVGYLVLKYTDDPLGQWPDAEYTVDLTDFPYYHKACGATDPVGEVIPVNYTDGDAGATFTHRNALLDLFTADKFMSPINAPNSYGLTGKINPGDVNVILGSNLQLNGIGEHNMGNIYNIQRRDASVEPNSVKFTAAANNHINDTENFAATGITDENAFRHVMIRYEYANHSYIVYVDDHAPAGDYEITYKLENKENNTQHGNVLYLTFKFSVKLRDITVERDETNWINSTTIRGTHARIHNTIVDPVDPDFTSWFTWDWEGYKVDLKQAFVLDGQEMVITTTAAPAGAGANPGYRPMFEFIQSQSIENAGFTYVRNDDNYLTILRHTASGENAAVIENVPSSGGNVAYNRLHILVNEGGDMLYNYLTSEHNNVFGTHNTFTKWGRTELMLQDDMEKLLPVRMVTDINGECANPDTFANNNYYYIHDFNVKFERALRWAFTTIELEDNQQLQKAAFDFSTKNTTRNIYRGLFDHAYDSSDGYGNLVAIGLAGDGNQWSRHNPGRQAWFYGLDTPPLVIPDANQHTAKVDADNTETYIGIDYTKVEVSKDGGTTWTAIDNDYQLTGTHDNRYFDIKLVDPANPISWEARWQGDHTPINRPLFFRVPVTNETARDNGFAPETGTGYWMTYRDGYAKVKGYAVFKINPRK